MFTISSFWGNSGKLRASTFRSPFGPAANFAARKRTLGDARRLHRTDSTPSATVSQTQVSPRQRNANDTSVHVSIRCNCCILVLTFKIFPTFCRIKSRTRFPLK